mmetsp:Transcript_23641/g.61792  ORF Transcript_23641/g.61792 Transcript_23641/m.61792 type:complete len:232 (+) Transcript_23641:1116-1811(+)
MLLCLIGKFKILSRSSTSPCTEQQPCPCSFVAGSALFKCRRTGLCGSGNVKCGRKTDAAAPDSRSRHGSLGLSNSFGKAWPRLGGVLRHKLGMAGQARCKAGQPGPATARGAHLGQSRARTKQPRRPHPPRLRRLELGWPKTLVGKVVEPCPDDGARVAAGRVGRKSLGEVLRKPRHAVHKDVGCALGARERVAIVGVGSHLGWYSAVSQRAVPHVPLWDWDSRVLEPDQD